MGNGCPVDHQTTLRVASAQIKGQTVPGLQRNQVCDALRHHRILTGRRDGEQINSLRDFVQGHDSSTVEHDCHRDGKDCHAYKN